MNIQTNAALYQDVMAIGVNYRLGAWGWFYLNEKEDDQEWQGKDTAGSIKGFSGQAHPKFRQSRIPTVKLKIPENFF